MKRRLEKLIERGAIALAIVLGIGWPLYCLYGFWYMEARLTRPEALLHRTDYQETRDACREMMARHREGEFPDDNFLRPEDPRVPGVLRALRPSYTTVRDDEVVVEMQGGGDQYGFYAYSKGCIREGRESASKLIDGL